MVWQTLQRGTPDRLARTRFFVPQFGHATIVEFSGITLLPARHVPAPDAASPAVDAAERAAPGHAAAPAASW
jgi:hypothetical protein